ncbi:DNA gyrase subunit B [Embleya scabrispora]|uniref:DNA topoisomerase (ATP-hydrolyzing) n=1 Tax=Embleya scabrispora TaxID=159449 RepID=A0A1T3NS03_9ACTN|nr:ATP-binding protein [Embleya scabrispora]OPC79578.1 DNA gyrase subunit B [Embleya scabrispora]
MGSDLVFSWDSPRLGLSPHTLGGDIVSGESIGYGAGDIRVLEGWEAVRKRPGMYIGSTGERGLHQLVFDVADRAVTEVLTGRTNRVDVAVTPDGGVRVADDGPGIPVEDGGDTGGPGLEALLTRQLVGPRPGGRHDVTLGWFGAGLFEANALSSRTTAEVRREGFRWVQEYARGVAVTPLSNAGPASGSGTTITFWPDAEIFGTAQCSFDTLAERFRELAFLNRDLEISLTDRRRPDQSRSERFRSPGGARDFVAFLDAQAAAPVHPDVIGFDREDPRMAGTMEVALRWRDSGMERLRSFANSRPTSGGTHEAGLRDGMADVINAYARKRRLLRATDPDLGADRIGEGLTAVVSVKLDRPEFQGSTREVLGNPEVATCVRQAVREHLGTWLEEHPESATAVIDRIVRSGRRD